MPGAEDVATAAAVESVTRLLASGPRRSVLVRSLPGGGAALIAEVLADRDAPPATVVDLDALDDDREAGADRLLALRRQARTEALVIATERDRTGAGVAALLDYLDPATVEVAPLRVDEVVDVVEAITGLRVDDHDGELIRRWTDGRAGDVVDVGNHLRPSDPPTAGALLALTARSLDAFEASEVRRSRWVSDPQAWVTWALADQGGITTAVPVPAPGAAGIARPLDAAAVLASATPEQRRTAIEAVLDAASNVEADRLEPEALLWLGARWCERGRDAIDPAELGHLIGAVRAAFDRNLLADAAPLARRLWDTTRVPLAGVALASALGRSDPDAGARALLDDLDTSSDPSIVDAAIATRATWWFHHEGRADDAVALLTAGAPAGGSMGQVDDARVSTLATIELHRGHPDATEALLDARRTDASGPTSFAVNALVLADLARGRHQRAIDRLDAELEQRLEPGPNLSGDRYRYYRALASALAGWADPTVATELDDAYRRALANGDDWTIGWIGWGAGAHAARAGRFAVARRRLRAAVDAFERAHRPGFAMWPATGLVELAALTTDAREQAAGTELDVTIPFDHAVVADRAAAELALTQLERARGADPGIVRSRLASAMRTAHGAGEVTTSVLIAIEQLLAGLDPDDPLVDESADGVLVEVWPALVAGGASLDSTGRTLVDRGWPVLGTRLRAAASARVHRTDPRAASRILQDVRSTVSTFDSPMQPWVLGEDRLPALPTLSARERDVAERIAGGASREQVAADLVVSRRTVDSHLQRVYAKLGVSSRDELRAWLEGV